MRKEWKRFLLLGVMLFSIMLFGCTEGETVDKVSFSELIANYGYDVSDIQSVDYHASVLSSIITRYEQENELALLLNSLDQMYLSITEETFRSLCSYEELSFLYLNFEGGSIQLSIAPDGTCILTCKDAYFMSQHAVNYSLFL